MKRWKKRKKTQRPFLSVCTDEMSWTFMNTVWMSALIRDAWKISSCLLSLFFFCLSFFPPFPFRSFYIWGCVWLTALEPHLPHRVWSTCRMMRPSSADTFGLCSPAKRRPLPQRLKEEKAIQFRSTWICCSSCCRLLEVNIVEIQKRRCRQGSAQFTTGAFL